MLKNMVVRKPVKFSLVWFTLLSFGGEDLFPQTWFHVCIGTAAHQALVQYSAGWLSFGGQMSPLQPHKKREGGASLLSGTKISKYALKLVNDNIHVHKELIVISSSF